MRKNWNKNWSKYCIWIQKHLSPTTMTSLLSACHHLLWEWLYRSDQLLKGYDRWLKFHNKICETYLDKWWLSPFDQENLGPFLSLFIHKCITPQLLINGKLFVFSVHRNRLFYHESAAVKVFLPDFHGSFQKLNPCPLINWIIIKWLLIYDTMTRAIFHADTFHKSQRERLRRKDLVLII